MYRPLEGETNIKGRYYLFSTAPSSQKSEFGPKLEPVDPNVSTDDCAPFGEISGDFNRSWLRLAENSCGEEPYSSENIDTEALGSRNGVLRDLRRSQKKMGKLVEHMK